MRQQYVCQFSQNGSYETCTDSQICSANNPPLDFKIDTRNDDYILNWYDQVGMQCMDNQTIKLLTTIYFISFAFGGLLFYTPDRYGRKWTTLITTFFLIIGMLIAVFSTSYITKAIGLVVMGLFHIKTSISYVFMFESVHSRNKAFCSTVINIIDGIPVTLTCVYLRWISHDLILLQSISIYVTIGAWFMLFLIPESAPWLLATGQRKRAILTFNYIAWFNGSK